MTNTTPSNIAIIGAGISGLANGQLLTEKGHQVTIFEKQSAPGGLIRCTRENGNLFHRVGGHVFNTKNLEVAEWFWSFFDKETEFLFSKRNAKIFLNNQFIEYPFENAIYRLKPEVIKQIIDELLSLEKNNNQLKSNNFEDFLRNSFGDTLFQQYFKPYNNKIWKSDLSQIPLPWLDGKLPMPDTKSIFFNNITRGEESEMVHSTFNYPVNNGSSFIAERLSENLNIRYNEDVREIEKTPNGWKIENESFDAVVFTGDVRTLNNKLNLHDEQVSENLKSIKNLKSNGTSNCLCTTDKSYLSWLYFPDSELLPHRIIYTGNFSSSNNATQQLTCTVEFSGKYDNETIKKELKKLPGNLKPIAFNYEPNSYVIQNFDTRENISKLKESLSPYRFFLCGRFAEWEYYNMDKAIESAMNLAKMHF